MQGIVLTEGLKVVDRRGGGSAQEPGSLDAEMQGYLRAFAAVVVPGSLISLALSLTALATALV